MVTGLAVFLEMSLLPLLGSARMGVSVRFQGSAPLPPVTVGITVLFKAVSQLSLPGSQDRWGKGGRFTISPCLPAMAVNTDVLFKASQPHLLVSAEMGKGKGCCLFWGEILLLPLLHSRLKYEGYISTSPPLPYSLELRWAPNCICCHCLVFPSSCLFYSCQYSHFQMFQHVDLSSVFVCWGEDPLLSYSCLTCEFKRRNKGINSLCHNADIFMWLFHYKNMSVLPLGIRDSFDHAGVLSSNLSHSVPSNCWNWPNYNIVQKILTNSAKPDLFQQSVVPWLGVTLFNR